MTFDEIVKWNQKNVHAKVFADGLHRIYSGALFINSDETVMIGTDEIYVDAIQRVVEFPRQESASETKLIPVAKFSIGQEVIHRLSSQAEKIVDRQTVTMTNANGGTVTEIIYLLEHKDGSHSFWGESLLAPKRMNYENDILE